MQKYGVVQNTMFDLGMCCSMCMPSCCSVPERMCLYIMEKIKIGDIELNGRVVLGPMAGVTTLAYREIGRAHV